MAWHHGDMRRTVQSQITVDVIEPSELVMSVAVASRRGVVEETMAILLDGKPLDVRVIHDSHGTRLHRFHSEPGALTLDYAAVIEGRDEPAPVTERDLIRYGRQSRYCESDILAATAMAEFEGLEGRALLDGVSSWVGTRLEYVPGSSQHTDGAVATLLARRGVCRDYAHLCVALLRSCDVPARLVSVYAPGLSPMDFHAVCEAYIDGAWWVVDATAHAPRESLVRIATGRDAADTAFMTLLTGKADFTGLTVGAVADVLPIDDVAKAVQLG